MRSCKKKRTILLLYFQKHAHLMVLIWNKLDWIKQWQNLIFTISWSIIIILCSKMIQLNDVNHDRIIIVNVLVSTTKKLEHVLWILWSSRGCKFSENDDIQGIGNKIRIKDFTTWVYFSLYLLPNELAEKKKEKYKNTV